MKKVININFQGRVVPIEETAYDILKQYVDSLRKFFANEEGRDEIINDIESRIAELFGETLKKGSTCITDDDVNNIIASMGRPEEFEGEEASVKSQLQEEQKQQQSQQQSSSTSGGAPFTAEPRRLYRDENHKVLGGVCSGIANYFGIDSLVVRILFIVCFGIAFIPYLILWIAVPSSATQVIGSTRKRLFRNSDDKIIAGVCSGLANYFGVNVWIPRILFLIPFITFVFRWSHWGMFNFPHFLSLSFSPGATIIYIILWLVVPEATSAADKLEMKGERVDLNSIKNTIQGDLEGFKERAQQFGEEIKDKAQQFGNEFSNTAKQKFNYEAAYTARKNSRGFGDVIAMIAKGFAYFILAIVVFAVVVALFSIGVVFIGLLPIKNYVIKDDMENLLAWGSLILFIWVPIIGIITWIIRRIAKIRSNSHIMRYTFIALWLLGLFCTIGLITSLSNDFAYRNNPVEENIAIANPKVNKLEVKIGKYTKYYRSNLFRMEPFVGIEDDTAFVRNVRIRIVKSNTDSFALTEVRLCNGNSRKQANELASKIDYSVSQADTSLLLDRGIAINTSDKFRNQHVILTIAVPVGKKILINENVGWGDNVRMHFNFNDNNDWNYSSDWDNGEESWEHDVEYIMTTKGLERVHKIKQDDSNNDDNSNDAIEEYRKSRDQLKKEIDQQQKQLDEKRKELEKAIDTTGKYHYQKTAVLINKTSSTQKKNVANDGGNELYETPARFLMLQATS